MASVGTAGATGTGVTLTSPLAFAHAAGATADVLVANSGLVGETFKLDSTPPVITYTGGGTYTVDQTVNVTCLASDPSPGSGLASDTCQNISAPAYTFAINVPHTVSATATDNAGNTASNSTSFTVIVTFASLDNLVAQFSSNASVTSGLQDKLDAARNAKNAKTRGNLLDAFDNQVRAQTGKALTAEEAALLTEFADALR